MGVIKSLPHLRVDDELRVALCGRSEDVGDLVDLVEVVLAREGRPVAHHLGQAAAHSPHVHALGVALEKTRKIRIIFTVCFLCGHIFRIITNHILLVSNTL